jgi:pimeloyl-ACP methyl ester carboxylesterase
MSGPGSTDGPRIERRPYMTVAPDRGVFKDAYGGDLGWVYSECMLIRPEGTTARNLIVFSHPIGGGAFLPIMKALAQAGHHVLFVNGRYRGNDTALIMENCVADLGACMADAARRFGYEQFVLGGWSGGGSLALYYQEQAVHRSVTATPAGDPVDLAGADLPPAAGVLLVAAHVGRNVTLTDCLDPSIVDEADGWDTPGPRNAEFDLFDSHNPHQPPYSADFLQRYRAAQVARNHHITARVRARLEQLRQAGGSRQEHCFTVHGTNADPRWLDPAVDPNGRRPGMSWVGEPAAANHGPIGLARFTTLRSWLSQWSLDAHCHGERNAANVDVPALVIANGADEVCTPSHLQRLHDALASTDKRLVTVDDASHYYVGQPDALAHCVQLCSGWLEDHGWVG